MTDPELTHAMIGAAIDVHRQLGPGVLESAYEECMARELALRSALFDRQKALPVADKGVRLECGYRLDLLVDGRVVVEFKAVEALAPIQDVILLTYPKLSGCKIGLLINFNRAMLKDGIRRRVLRYDREPATHRRGSEDPEEKLKCPTAEFES